MRKTRDGEESQDEREMKGEIGTNHEGSTARGMRVRERNDGQGERESEREIIRMTGQREKGTMSEKEKK